MILEPEAVRSRQFVRAWPGYDMAEVDAFLAEVADVMVGGGPVATEGADDHFLEAGREVAGALRSLHDTLVEVRQEGERDAEQLRQAARREASAHLDQARRDADELRRRAEHEAAAARHRAVEEVEEARRAAGAIVAEAAAAAERLDAEQHARAEAEVARVLAERRDELDRLEARRGELLGVEGDLRSHLADLSRRLGRLAEQATPGIGTGTATDDDEAAASPPAPPLLVDLRQGTDRAAARLDGS